MPAAPKLRAREQGPSQVGCACARLGSHAAGHGPTFATDCARPHAASHRAGPLSASFAGAAPKLRTPASPGSAFRLSPPDAGTWNPVFKPRRHRCPQNLLQFKLSAFLVPAPGSARGAAECVDAGR
ncbi:hypothetical protein I79_016815 [Cricetulus griseus]|uniref:Uncharacterized protein n=1 Tax=Cricetulus griseus TaxID=10029 RepID=G3I0D6_CRIGR|nr:hypothetical protein I79_016815 [Cricetulus griseus]ERE88647.1 hypothetical protein H671_1g2891 [Cricetulus griseus]